MASTEPPSTTPGAAIYSFPFLLRLIYDIWVLGITNTYIWRCSTSAILLPFFKKHKTAHHLDIGVGTGYFLKYAGFEKNAEVTLVDLNQDSLDVASKRIPELRTKCIEHDVLKPLPIPADQKFESISLMYLLHCMPGPPESKAAIFSHLKHNLADDGVLFGATVLGKGVEHNWAGRVLMRTYNQQGIFGNLDDGAEVFLKELKANFEEVEAEVRGVVLLFVARYPKR
jgi:SAM-dependent methyltransferase